MKILIPTADYPPIEGGIATVALRVSRELAGMGHTVTVVAPYFPEMDDFDLGEPVSVVRFRGYRLGWFRFFPMLAATWRHTRGTDLILGINAAYGGLVGRLARCLYGKPYVTFAYAYEFLRFRRVPFLGGLLRLIYRGSRVVAAISTFTRNNLVRFGVPEEKVATILPGAPSAESFTDEALAAVRRKFVLETGRVILAVGRLIPRKGHVTLVRALPRILERVPEALLVIVGRGPSTPDVVREAWALGVRDRVLLAGRLPESEVAALYRICEVFALPTGSCGRGQVEGFGLVFAEAQAYGKPVVAGRSGGVSDAVHDGETGLLVDPDSPEALADAVVSLMGNPALAAHLGANGRRRVETELNWTRFTQRLLEEIEARA